MNKKDAVLQIFEKAIEPIAPGIQHDFAFETPKNPAHGDLTTSIAMRLARVLKKSPMIIASEIVNNLELKNLPILDKVEIVNPGFINVKLNIIYYHSAIAEMYDKGEKIGRIDLGHKKKVNVEYVSANPTGLLHLGHGRNACLGDTIANLYEWTGYDVTREYYFNNAGNQMHILGDSIYARYMQIFKGEEYPFPENGYHGDYIITIANELKEKYNDSLTENTEENLNICRKCGEEWCFEKIKNTLQRMGIVMDDFYNEDSLYKTGKIDEVIRFFKDKNFAYEKDGATWLRFTELGLPEDRVIIKASGEPTYRLPDIAYHREKFRRGFDVIVDIFGSDHIATIPDVMSGVKAMGFDTDIIKPVIYQFVTLTENGEQVKMSKRSGKSYTLDMLLDEVSPDVVRFFLLMRSYSTHLEFNLDIAREQSEKNPVFYLQYAHARIASVIDNATRAGASMDGKIDFSLLTEPQEIALIDEAGKFESCIADAARKCEPQILADYLRNFASSFHSFYHDCRIIGVDAELQKARLALSITAKNIIHNGLTVMGISAPERM